MKLADFIRSENLNPTNWAKKVGIPQPVISRYLSGKRGISLKTALKIQTVTNGAVRMEDLAGNNGECEGTR